MLLRVVSVSENAANQSVLYVEGRIERCGLLWLLYCAQCGGVWGLSAIHLTPILVLSVSPNFFLLVVFVSLSPAFTHTRI